MAYTGLGTVVSISAARPTSYDDDATTGFPSLTYTEIEGLLSTGAVIGGTWGSTTDTVLETGEVVTSKTSKTAQEFTVSHFSDETNAGITLLQEAFESRDYYSFEMAKGDGTTIYFEAHVMGNNDSGANTEEHEKIEYTIMPRALGAVRVSA